MEKEANEDRKILLKYKKTGSVFIGEINTVLYVRLGDIIQITIVSFLKNMNNNNNTQQNLEFPPSKVVLPAETDVAITINIDDIKQNSILLVKLNIEPEQKMTIFPILAKLFAPYASQLKNKKVSIMMLTLNENIEIVDEAEMNQSGWFKKEKSLIINPYK